VGNPWRGGHTAGTEERLDGIPIFKQENLNIHIIFWCL